MALREFLDHSARAAIAADRRYGHTQDVREIRLGIEVWEQLVAAGGLEEVAPEELVDAYLAASMLYARRHEVAGRVEDLGHAFRYLQEARRRVAPGSFADLQVRMSTAAWLMARYQSGGPPEDLDRAISGWAELVETDAGALAAANLGRALLARHDRTGDPDDLQDGRRVLGMASAQLPRDHPALAEVELALRRA
jgi:hypothetical protein